MDMLFKNIGIFNILNFILIAIVIFFEKKRIRNTLSWIVILSLTSYFGFILYILFGLSFKKRRLVKNKKQNDLFKDFIKKRNALLDKNIDVDINEDYFGIINYHERNSRSLYYPFNKLEFFYNGDELFNDLIIRIKNAKSFIHIETYIFRNDNLGKLICDELLKKSLEGIEIILIYDGMGSVRESSRIFKKLLKSGARIAEFLPPYLPIFSHRVNYRNHRKITIIDGEYGYIGGFNIGDEYLGLDKKLGNWRDTHLLMMGDVIDSLSLEFLMDYEFITGVNLYLKDDKLNKKYFFNREKKGSSLVQIVGSGPNYLYSSIKAGMIKMISQAKKSIYIQTPYFIPDDEMLELLMISIMSGVKVDIMIPIKADHYLVNWANYSFIGELISIGANIHLYDNGFLHSKLVLVDEMVGTIGSANFDQRSFYYNFEINAFIYDKEVIEDLIKQFNIDLKYCRRYTLSDFEKRNNFKRFKESMARLLSPIL